MNLPAQANNEGKGPGYIHIGETSLEMFEAYLTAARYKWAGARASYRYTGEYVWPIVKEFLQKHQPDSEWLELEKNVIQIFVIM